ncbi:hypothetical protein LZ30DRAFT_34910 [Colletotrichum cereale]|nr:hypothetical protein LZ30DRAFT_34910 [Colletotrichum cereale]
MPLDEIFPFQKQALGSCCPADPFFLRVRLPQKRRSLSTTSYRPYGVVTMLADNRLLSHSLTHHHLVKRPLSLTAAISFRHKRPDQIVRLGPLHLRTRTVAERHSRHPKGHTRDEKPNGQRRFGKGHRNQTTVIHSACPVQARPTASHGASTPPCCSQVATSGKRPSQPCRRRPNPDGNRSVLRWVA